MIIICPNTGDECDKHIQYIPKSAFLITAYLNKNEGFYEEITKIEETLRSILKRNDFSLEIAKDKFTTGNMLCKICAYIQATSFSLALYTSKTPKRSVPNIFYEIGIAQTFGKSVYLMGGKKIKRPSDLGGLEWVKFDDINDLDQKFEDIFNKVNQKSKYYNTIGNLKFNAKNYGEAFWYYKTAYLLNPTDEIKNTIIKINEKLNSLNNTNNMDISLQREIDSITKFLAFI